MATTILTKRSNTASAVPLAADLTNSSSGSELAVNTADKRLFTKDSGGTVVELGINPSSLTLSGGTANGVLYLNGSKVATSGSALTFDGTTLSAARYISTSSSASLPSYAVESGSGIFNAGASTIGFSVGSSEGMRLTSTGLGIGTSSPSYKLQARSSGTSTSFAGNIVARLESNGSGYSSTLQFSNNVDASATLGLVGSALGFGIGTTEYMRLDSSGNLGLGVTPSAWYSGYKAFQFGNSGGGALSQDNTNGFTHFTQNTTYTGNNSAVYQTSGYATRYTQAGGGHYWLTAASGTAGNAITFTQAMTLDASGNLLVGATSVGYSAKSQFVKQGSTSANNSVTDSAVLVASASAAAGETIGLRLKTGAGISGTTFAGQLISSGNNIFEVYTAGASPLVFGTDATERARIDSSGNLLVGTTSNNGIGISLQYGGGDPSATFNGNSSSNTVISFRYNSTQVGSITRSTTATAFNTSSDYRLKNTIAPMTGALAKVALLKPCTYKWNADGSDGQGFIAHELAEVVPQCVTGEKDAVDEDGNPQYQGIDTSFLVATLTAAIQELKAEFDAYKASHP